MFYFLYYGALHCKKKLEIDQIYFVLNTKITKSFEKTRIVIKFYMLSSKILFYHVKLKYR